MFVRVASGTLDEPELEAETRRYEAVVTITWLGCSQTVSANTQVIY